MPTLRDLKTAAAADKATDDKDTAILAADQATKARDDATLAADDTAFAAAIQAAGGTVVDTATNPPTLYTSTDGKTVTAQPVPSLDAPVPTPGA